MKKKKKKKKQKQIKQNKTDNILPDIIFTEFQIHLINRELLIDIEYFNALLISYNQ